MYMEIIKAIILGIVEGITEWLPISSEGQSMLVMMGWLGISPNDAFSFPFCFTLEPCPQY